MVDISLYDHDVKNVVQSLIEGLTLLPNVHTVKLSIICSHKWSPTLEMLVNSSRRICQSVDRVYLSPFLTCLHPLFPNARQLESFHGKALTSFLLSDVPSVNTSVEVLDCVDHSVWAAPGKSKNSLCNGVESNIPFLSYRYRKQVPERPRSRIRGTAVHYRSGRSISFNFNPPSLT